MGMGRGWDEIHDALDPLVAADDCFVEAAKSVRPDTHGHPHARRVEQIDVHTLLSIRHVIMGYESCVSEFQAPT